MSGISLRLDTGLLALCLDASCLSAHVIVERFSEFGAGRSSDKVGFGVAFVSTWQAYGR